MSNKMPYYSIDKVSATVSIDAKARAKWDKRASEAGVAVTTLMAQFLEQEVRDDPFTIEDLQAANAYMLKNQKLREARAKRVGARK